MKRFSIFGAQKKTSEQEVFNRLNRKMDDFLQTRNNETRRILHDIRNPLNVIKLSTVDLEKLFKHTISSQEAEHAIFLKQKADTRFRHIRKGLEDINQIINEVLQETCEEPLHVTSINLFEMLRQLVDTFQNTYSSGDKTFELYYAIDDEHFVFDRERIRCAVENLLSNAQRHTSRGMVIVEVRKDQRDVIIHVKDSGSGMSDDEIEELFSDPGTDATGEEPHGIGLFNVRRTMEAHRGSVEVYSKPGIGSIFTLRLPREPGEPS